jgi:hypothetical protein
MTRRASLTHLSLFRLRFFEPKTKSKTLSKLKTFREPGLKTKLKTKAKTSSKRPQNIYCDLPYSLNQSEPQTTFHFWEFFRPITALRLSQSQPCTSFLFRYIPALYYKTSFWPCLRHGELTSSLPLPPAQAIACWRHCPQTPFLYNNLILLFIIVSIVFSISNQQILLFIIPTA